MTVQCVFFDCDGTLVDSERLCTQAYVNTFAQFGAELSMQDMFEKYKGVKLYDIISDVCMQFHLTVTVEELEPVYRKEVARLFDLQLKPIAGAKALLEKMAVPICVVSNGTVSKMQHSLGLTAMLSFFDNRLYSGYTINSWKPDADLLFYAAKQMGIPIENCILVDDSQAGAQAGISAGIPVFYFCADADNKPLDNPLVTSFNDLAQLPELWRTRGWLLTTK